ncbi:DMT family transporter [Alicyclobacillus fastidiosus]|uniref:DMT family transporter n=1 Tax=Alicyclobacillus fastidiosus TaxID=392011 RepID=A0ABY6ZDI1_9BACL|nr:DMT family transporter [Alicyclobacillus fastidiosus]WAH40906.1 DMT family transporter [Alicyclobacillus fastidiosus]
MKPPRSVFFALLIVANLVWSMSFAATSVATGQMSPIFLTMTRLFVGGTILFPFVIRALRRNRAAMSARAMTRSALLGLIGFTVPVTLETIGIHASTAALGAVSIALEPLFTVLIAAVVLRQRLSTRRKIAMAMAAIGAYVVGGCPRPGVAGYALGDVLLLLAVLCYACYNALSASMTENVPASAAMSIMLLAGFLGCTPLWVISGHPWPHHLGTGPLLSLAFLSLCATAGAYLVWLFVLQDQDVSRAAITLYLQPIFGVLFSIVITHTAPTLFFYVGASLILMALYLGRNVEPRAAAIAMMEGSLDVHEDL